MREDRGMSTIPWESVDLPLVSTHLATRRMAVDTRSWFSSFFQGPPASPKTASFSVHQLFETFIVSAAGVYDSVRFRETVNGSLASPTLCFSPVFPVLLPRLPSWEDVRTIFRKRITVFRCLPSFRWPVGPESGTFRLDLSETLPQTKSRLC